MHEEVTTTSPQILAHRALDVLKSEGFKQFSARPHNFRSPESTIWWLVPSKEWPAYKHGKLMIHRFDGVLHAGICIEKGLSNAAASVLSPSRAAKLRLAMDWTWHRLEAEMGSGVLKDRLDALAGHLERPLKIMLWTGIVPTEYEPGSPMMESADASGTATFVHHQGALSVCPGSAKGVLERKADIQTLEQLKDLLDHPDLAWHWVNVYVLFEVTAEDEARIAELLLGCLDSLGELVR